MAKARPVGTKALPPPGFIVMSSAESKSQPASPAFAYFGKGKSGSKRFIGSFISGEGYTLKKFVLNRTRFFYAHEMAKNALESANMLAWIDLEMTGLDPDLHVIVEIATLITDDQLNLIAEGPDLVISATEEQLEKMDPVVVEMHTKSGLLDEIKASEITLEEAGSQTLSFLMEHIGKKGTVPLCGNSIGTDRRFLAKWLPEIENFLHYRSVDVTSIKELGKRWFPKSN